MNDPATPINQSTHLELANDYISITSRVTLHLIQALNLQSLETQELIERLSTQMKDVDTIELVASELSEEERRRSERTRTKLESTKIAIAISKNTQNILASTILQVAQQGMSTIHGGIGNYPNKGRSVYGVNLCELVWQGRNQAMHYETTARRADWKHVFKSLNSSFPGRFDLTPPFESRAKDIIDILGWDKHSVYEADLRSLLIQQYTT